MHKSTERERSATRPMKTSELKQKRNGRVRRTDPVRPMTNNLAETVFVFESTRKPYQTHVVYLDQASCYVDHPGWKHTATLEPSVWIEHLMNNPAERAKQIESLCHRPNAPHELPATKTI